ncbi:cupin domain-containing protein [Paenibacillus sinopodophylli]|uniref:cupin domain-containing protein n=1 Tax=Paenibacillus sinopodophylli TaxID=1837342 RepID=UPI00110CD78C|nr:cupin domain-containing protein [Paenibacillus sinopodophylli]
MSSQIDYTSPGTQFAFDVNSNPIFKKDANNYINLLSVNQLNTLRNLSLLDIFLSKGNVIEPHYHQNASELVYCISGAAEISLLNPFTKQYLRYHVTPGQVVNLPQGWWHYEIATQDHTHLLAIFDANVPDVIYGSDLLRLTPANVFAYTYCLDAEALKTTLEPIKNTVVLGPPSNCSYNPVQGQSAANPSANQGFVAQQAVQPNQAVQPQKYGSHHHRAPQF